MRHPRLLLPLSLLGPALVGCGDTYTATASATGTTTDASTTEAPEPTSTGEPTGGPLTPEIPDNRYFLRIDDTPPPPVVLEMDKAKALEIFGETAAKEIKLLDVDSTGLLDNVLYAIRDSCGDTWDDYVDVPDNQLPVDPGHDCALTTLGQSYGPDWKTTPQYAMVRLLTMTPRNATVATTEFDRFEALFKQNNNSFGGYSFSDVLAAALFCGIPDANDACADDAAACTKQLNQFSVSKPCEEQLHTRPFIPIAILRDALKTTLLASHPNIGNDQGLLPVTLYDALMDMQPLSDKLGPVGDHPGLLLPDDADFTTKSDALTPAFKMTATADSNLRRVDGIDASEGAGEMFLSLAAAPIAFDFNDPSRVKFEGIAAAPTVDMRMAIAELDHVVPACVDGLATCEPNLPGSPVGDQYVWSQPLWSLERIVATAGHAAFGTRVYEQCIVPLDPICIAHVSIGAGGDPAGWSIFTTDFMSVYVPPPQYFWELLLGIAQAAIHDPQGDDYFTYVNMQPIEQNTADNIPEGEARPVFALKGVPIGLTADEMIAQIRPTLQSQADVIADVILGNYWQNNARLDFYYRRASDGGTPYLFFVGPDDKRPAAGDPTQLAAYDYAKPGFFSDPGLTDKVSATSIPGVPDTAHEKYRLPEGASTLYMQDDLGDAYELKFAVPSGADPVEIVVRVTKL